MAQDGRGRAAEAPLLDEKRGFMKLEARAVFLYGMGMREEHRGQKDDCYRYPVVPGAGFRSR